MDSNEIVAEACLMMAAVSMGMSGGSAHRFVEGEMCQLRSEKRQRLFIEASGAHVYVAPQPVRIPVSLGCAICKETPGWVYINDPREAEPEKKRCPNPRCPHE